MGKRIIKTTILFAAFILVGLFVRSFVSDNELLVSTDSDSQQARASESCKTKSLC